MRFIFAVIVACLCICHSSCNKTIGTQKGKLSIAKYSDLELESVNSDYFFGIVISYQVKDRYDTITIRLKSDKSNYRSCMPYFSVEVDREDSYITNIILKSATGDYKQLLLRVNKKHAVMTSAGGGFEWSLDKSVVLSGSFNGGSAEIEPPTVK